MNFTGDILKALRTSDFTFHHAKLRQSCPTLCDPIDGTQQAPLSLGCSRQEYWSGLPLSSPGDLLNPGMEPMSPALTGGFWSKFQTLCF